MYFARERIQANVSEGAIGEARNVSEATREDEILEFLARARGAALAEWNDVIARLNGFESVDDAFADKADAPAALAALEAEHAILMKRELAYGDEAEADGISDAEREELLDAARATSYSRRDVERSMNHYRSDAVVAHELMPRSARGYDRSLTSRRVGFTASIVRLPTRSRDGAVLLTWSSGLAPEG
jgi:hypothetical protein